MPLYDFFCLATARATPQHLAKLMKHVSHLVGNSGGVIRKIENFGIKPLAKRVKAHSEFHETGRYFSFHVQASPASIVEVKNHLAADEALIRFRPFKTKTVLVRPQPTVSSSSSVENSAPVLSEAHYDALRRTTNIDYYIARSLLQAGKLTKEQVVALGRHSPKLDPLAQSVEGAHAAALAAAAAHVRPASPQ